MTVQTIYVTRMNVALSSDTALLMLGSPSGPINGGRIGTEESLRVIISHARLREMAALMAQRVAEIDAQSASVAVEAAAGQVLEAVKRSFAAEEDDAAVNQFTLQ